MTDVRRLHVERTADPSVLRWVAQHPSLAAAAPGQRVVPRTSGLGELIAQGSIGKVVLRNGDLLISAEPSAWTAVAPLVRAAILSDLTALTTEGSAHWLLVSDNADEDPTLDDLQQLVDRSAGAAMSSHGGTITVTAVNGSIVTLRAAGACHGCSQSDQTLLQLIVPAIQAIHPQITDVVFEPESMAPSVPLTTRLVRAPRRKRRGASDGPCH